MLIGAAVLAAIVVVLVARWLRTLPGVVAFVDAYPGVAAVPAGAPAGVPVWLAWQHALNAVFLLFVLRSGWRMRAPGRPDTFWTRTAWTKRRDGRPSRRNPPVRISIHLWEHIAGDVLWVLNGVVFVVLLFATGQWLRIVPTGWDVVPNAASAALQYASLQWPTHDTWVSYNALQLLSYFVIVFLAAPVAVVTGVRAAPGFAARLRPLDGWFPVAVAKRIHFWDMVVFVAFIVVHVFLVATTGLLRNLNHMFAVRDDESAVGLVVFLVAAALTAALVLALRPPVVRRVAAIGGTVLHRPRPSGKRTR